MLEAIADFWKPVKKAPPPPKLRINDLQIGSTVSFGYVPQAILSGRKLTVTAINSYQFGQDVLSSFVLSQEKNGDVSMIIAEAQGDQYLAISRRISADDRNKLFNENSIDEIISSNEINKFTCKDNVPELKGWLVANYKREIQGMRGFIHKADFRNGNTGLHAGEEFQYTLLGSNSNEHAIEIEAYPDGHIDVYATIYRRTSDISEVMHHDKSQKSSVKTESKSEDVSPYLVEKKPSVPVLESIAITTPNPSLEIEDAKDKLEPLELELVKPEPIKLESVSLPQLVVTPLVAEIVKSKIVTPESTTNNNEEKKDMSISAVISNETKLPNGQAGNVDLSSSVNFAGNAVNEFKAATKSVNAMDGGSIECELRVANQIIDEAIRNEMRLSDVVRRIIELPVSHQELVHIPINLADEDYSLLAIRYGIPSSDRNAIKIRIIQELGDFSGTKKKVA